MRESEMTFHPNKKTESSPAVPTFEVPQPPYWLINEHGGYRLVTQEPEESARRFDSLQAVIDAHIGARFEGQPESVRLADLVTAATESPHAAATAVASTAKESRPEKRDGLPEGPFYWRGKDSVDMFYFTTDQPGGKTQKFDTVADIFKYMAVTYNYSPDFYILDANERRHKRDDLAASLQDQQRAA